MNEEMLARLQKAKTVEEIIAIAKEYGKEVTEEKAQELLDRIGGADGELSDEALEAVVGGGYCRHYQEMGRKPFRQIKRQRTKRENHVKQGILATDKVDGQNALFSFAISR